jgi:DNA invertase Pin-like site-specific DNA recombinase
MVVGYIRVSTTKQDTDNQKGEIERWATYQNYIIEKYIVETISSSKKDRVIFKLVEMLGEGDVLVVTDISRIARSVKELLNITETLIDKKVRMVFIKEGLDLNDDSPASKLMLSILASVAEFERNMISMLTREAIQSKREKGIVVGRLLGSKNKEYKLIGKEKEILKYIEMKISKTNIAKIMGVSRPTLYAFLEENNCNKRTKDIHGATI